MHLQLTITSVRLLTRELPDVNLQGHFLCRPGRELTLLWVHGNACLRRIEVIWGYQLRDLWIRIRDDEPQSNPKEGN